MTAALCKSDIAVTAALCASSDTAVTAATAALCVTSDTTVTAVTTALCKSSDMTDRSTL